MTIFSVLNQNPYYNRTIGNMLLIPEPYNFLQSPEPKFLQNSREYVMLLIPEPWNFSLIQTFVST